MDFPLLFFLICLSTRDPCTGTIYITGTDTGVGCHSAGAGQVVPGTAEIDPSGCHSTGATVEIICNIVNGLKSNCHNSIGRSGRSAGKIKRIKP